MTRALLVVVAIASVAGCRAGVRVRYRGAPPPTCAGVRPYHPQLAPVPTACAEHVE